jgi:hypothetical protein
MKPQQFLAILAVSAGLVACANTSPTASAPTAAPAATPTPVARAKGEDVKSMLWVGNSFFYYNNSMHGHVGQLLTTSGGRGYRQSSATISGSGINWHDVEAHFKPGGVGSYSFVGDNEVRFNKLDRAFDAVMIMDCSQCPIHPQLKPIFYEYAAKHSATARKNGAEPIFFMSWAYADKPEMTDQLAAEYIAAGKQNKALVVPAGIAFANSLKARPDIALTIADKRHPTLAGTYLAACTVMASVFKRDPTSSSYTAGLPADVARHLQATAWAASRDFHAREGRGSLE